MPRSTTAVASPHESFAVASGCIREHLRRVHRTLWPLPLAVRRCFCLPLNRPPLRPGFEQRVIHNMTLAHCPKLHFPCCWPANVFCFRLRAVRACWKHHVGTRKKLSSVHAAAVQCQCRCHTTAVRSTRVSYWPSTPQSPCWGSHRESTVLCDA